MTRFSRLSPTALLGLALIAPPSTRAHRVGPPFAAYPAAGQFKGHPAPLDLATAKARRFRTNLARGVQGGPNFAGHYTVVEWGCGASCETVAIVDATTGKVFFAPFNSTFGVRYQLDSRLLVVDDPGECLDWHSAFDGSIHYYEWTGKALTARDTISARTVYCGATSPAHPQHLRPAPARRLNASALPHDTIPEASGF